QTLNELRARTERLADFGGADAVAHDIERLASRETPLVVNLGRQPGQREERFATTLVELVSPAPSTAVAARVPARRPAIHAPRLAPVDAATATPEQQELLASTGQPENHLFRTFARHPALFRRWLPFGGALLVRGEVDARHRELAILRTAFLVGAAYEWGHHVEIGAAAGLSGDDIDRVVLGPDAGWPDELDRLVLQACDDVHHLGVVGDDTWAGLASRLEDVHLVELTVLIGHYRMLAVVLGSLGVAPEEGLAPLPEP
ncbi:MAG TPA: DUF480 domain-containing protein, partial [Acidimicrobiales bacterium]|nr:DUF480 domain-containing protein [Acidimicrobiales bacterium]